MKYDIGGKAAESVPAVERLAFKDAHRHLELDEVPDAWGRPMFKHSHVEASWLGWIARAARAPADSVTAPAGAAAVIPQGWRLVPEAPTQLMVDAAKWNVDGRLSVFKWADGYYAMLSAAPTPPAQTAPVGGALRAQVETLTRDCGRQASKIAELIADLKFQEGRHREDRARLQAIYEQQRGECWYWQGDGQDHLESLCNTLPVVIRADQLRALVSTPPAAEFGVAFDPNEDEG